MPPMSFVVLGSQRAREKTSMSTEASLICTGIVEAYFY